MSAHGVAPALTAAAWDVDGTLVDSEPLHLQALHEVCRAHRVDLSDLGPTPFVGVAAPDVWRALAPRFGASLGTAQAQRAQAFLDAVAEHYRAGVHTLRPMPGAADALHWLDAQGVPMCAVSNSHAAIVEINLRAIGAWQCMRFAICLDHVARPKPDAEPYRLAARRLGTPAASIWALEDSASGTAAARAAGLHVVLVGTGEDADRAAAHAHRRASNLNEVLALWRAGRPASSIVKEKH